MDTSLMYESVPEHRAVWGLEARTYTQAEVDASEHLTWALRAGAFVKMETKTETRERKRGHAEEGKE